jgi:dienelactone hydrolase
MNPPRAPLSAMAQALYLLSFIIAVAPASTVLTGCAWPVSPRTSVRALSFRAGPYNEYATAHSTVESAPLAPSPERHPAVLVLHGGFGGDDRTSHDLAQKLAELHVLAVAPTFRGEPRHLDGALSQGSVEFCRGEVDDVRALLADLRRRPDVDPDRIGLLGFSHGGCIALQLAAGSDVKAVAVFSAPTDARAAYDNLRRYPLRWFGYNGWLGNYLAHAAGVDEPGLSAAERDARWRERSPAITFEPLRAPIHTRLLLIQGLADDILPAEELRRFGQLLLRYNRVEESRFDRKGHVVSTTSIAPEAGPGGGPPVEIRYFEGQGHTFDCRMKPFAEQLAIRFLTETLLSTGAPP